MIAENVNVTESNNQVICEFEKSETEVLRVSLTEFKGKSYVHFRFYFKNKAGEFQPTRRGIVMGVPLAKDLSERLPFLADRFKDSK